MTAKKSCNYGRCECALLDLFVKCSREVNTKTWCGKMTHDDCSYLDCLLLSFFLLLSLFSVFIHWSHAAFLVFPGHTAQYVCANQHQHFLDMADQRGNGTCLWRSDTGLCYSPEQCLLPVTVASFSQSWYLCMFETSSSQGHTVHWESALPALPGGGYSRIICTLVEAADTCQELWGCLLDFGGSSNCDTWSWQEQLVVGWLQTR